MILMNPKNLEEIGKNLEDILPCARNITATIKGYRYAYMYELIKNQKSQNYIYYKKIYH